MAVPGFVHLRAHSHYSLLSSPVRIRGLVKAAAADEQPALGLTDSGNLYGAVEFYKACKSADVKPVFGQVTFMAGRTRNENASADNPTYQITLLAENETGWDNLKKLSSVGFIEGFYYRPRIDRELLAEHSEGLIALSGDLSGEIGRALQGGDTAEACRVAGEFGEILGKDSFYLETLDTGLEVQKTVNPLLLEMHERLGLPIVATNDVHYLRQEEWIAQDIMTCIRSGKAVNDPNRQRFPSRELYFKTRAEMAALFAHAPQALASTVEIAERCSVEIDMKTYHLPVFDTGSDEHPDDMFERVCYEGAKQRYGEITPEIKKRLDYEISIIRQLGFCSYFLITADFIEYARGKDIPVGPGRGSAAGSIVAYCMRITDLDPLHYNLIFERFLNASRVSMPDIDIDFCGNRRDEVIDYVRNKYGEDCVSMIITFGTMASRGVIRDVGRVLDVPLADVDKIAKKVPQGPGASLEAALEADPELKGIRDESPTNKRLFDLSLMLEGAARHSSIHAAGVVVADRPLRDYVPLCKNGDDIVSQWQMTELEEVGLLKVDFLGLKTLTILKEGCRLVKQAHGVDLDLDDIPLDDAKTYALMSAGDTLGVFQLESSGMRELLARLKPDTFEDVIAVLALYRPGPLGSGMVDMFVRRKHGEEEVEYPHDSLAEILEETYGVITYQEQVMRISNVYAGFSMNEADSLRKAMGKKKPEVMAKFKEKFVDGAKETGHAGSDAKNLFETIEYFAGYGFNKSHSAAYALVTYQTAYLKAHYPVEFYAANMTVESGQTDKLKDFVDELRRKQLPIRPPDVNASLRVFNVEEHEIRYGLGAVKGVGSRVADAIAEERDGDGGGGLYTSLESLCSRIDQTLLNKTALDALVKAGAFDRIERSRKSAGDGIESAIRASAVAREDRRRGQGNLFGFEEPPAPATGRVEEWSEMERLNFEKEALGFYFSGHPFEKRGRFFSRIAGHTSTTIEELEHGTEIRIAGMMTGVRVLVVKSGRNAGKKMARFQLEDLDGALPAVVFARTYEVLHDRLVDDSIVFVEGRVDKKEEETGILVDGIRVASEVVGQEVHGVVVRLENGALQESMLDAIADLTRDRRGHQRLLLELEEEGRRFRVQTDSRFSVDVDDDLIDELATLVGPANLLFTRR